MLHICTLDKYNLVTTGTKRRTWTIVGLSRSQRTWSGWHCASSWQQDWGTPLSSPKGVSLLKWILKLWIVWPRVIFRFFIFSTQENKHNILIWFLCWSETIVVKLPTYTHLEFRENVLSPCESTYHRLTIERLTSLQRSRHRSTQVDVELHPTAPSLSVSTHFAPPLAPGRSWNGVIWLFFQIFNPKFFRLNFQSLLTLCFALVNWPESSPLQIWWENTLSVKH